MATKKIEPRAPRSTVFASKTTSGGAVSFEAYFLRDLYAAGKVTDKSIAEILKQDQIKTPLKDVLAALKDTHGVALPRGLARSIADLARTISERN